MLWTRIFYFVNQSKNDKEVTHQHTGFFAVVDGCFGGDSSENIYVLCSFM